MLGKRVEMQMRHRPGLEDRLRSDYKMAAYLLQDDHLVWSSDFEGIRKDLHGLIEEFLVSSPIYAPIKLTNIVKTLIDEEFDISI
jgi:hypothetical protein